MRGERPYVMLIDDAAGKATLRLAWPAPPGGDGEIIDVELDVAELLELHAGTFRALSYHLRQMQ